MTMQTEAERDHLIQIGHFDRIDFDALTVEADRKGPSFLPGMMARIKPFAPRQLTVDGTPDDARIASDRSSATEWILRGAGRNVPFTAMAERETGEDTRHRVASAQRLIKAHPLEDLPRGEDPADVAWRIHQAMSSLHNLNSPKTK